MDTKYFHQINQTNQKNSSLPSATKFGSMISSKSNFMSERLALKFFNVSRLVSDNLLFVMMKFLSSSKSVICFSSTFVIVFLSRSM